MLRLVGVMIYHAVIFTLIAFALLTFLVGGFTLIGPFL